METKILELSEWETPASHYAVEQKGNHRIAKHTYRPGLYVYHGMDGYSLFSVKTPLESTTLMELAPNSLGTLRWKEWMVDSPTDYRAMQIYGQKASGKVLTTGLGLGLLAHELVQNDKVTKITIVELSQSVIDLIGGYLPNDSRIEIVCEDFWKFVDKDNTKWDSIVADIWVFWGLEQQLSMYKNDIMPANERLKAKYPDAWITFHGFAGLPTLEQLEAVEAAGDSTNPLVIDPLIYGLGKNGATHAV